MDEQRALLDSLMGFNRNSDRDGQDEIKNYRDERVCKFYLLGMCPYEMFVNTKMAESGSCPKIHSDTLKEAFEADGDKAMFDSLIERDFVARINDIDRTIRRSRQRVEEEKGEESSNVESNPDLLRIQAEIEKYSADAEAAVENGDIDNAQNFMSMVDKLTQEKETILNRISEQRKALLQRTGVDVNKKLRVCDVCGSFLSILDSDKRLMDHFQGKQHMGYQMMRDYVAQIRERRESKRNAEVSGQTSANEAVEDFSRGRQSRRDSRERESDKSKDRGSYTRRDSRDRDSGRGRDSRDSGDRYSSRRESERDNRDYRRRSRSPRRDSRDRGRERRR